MADDTPNLAAELVRLKRAQELNRALIMICILLFLAVIAFLYYLQRPVKEEPREIISAQELTLVDRAGERLGSLSKGHDGPHVIILRDKARVEFKLGNHGPAL